MNKKETQSSIDNIQDIILNECNLLSLVFPKDMLVPRCIEACVNNKNIVLLIIESMCIGIVMPIHIANKFSYIVNAIKYDEYIEIVKNGMKIVSISNEWDTKKWSMTRIIKFYDILHEIENYCVEKIKEKMNNHEIIHIHKQNIDLNFLESLLWNANLDLD